MYAVEELIGSAVSSPHYPDEDHQPPGECDDQPAQLLLAASLILSQTTSHSLSLTDTYM